MQKYILGMSIHKFLFSDKKTFTQVSKITNMFDLRIRKLSKK